MVEIAEIKDHIAEVAEAQLSAGGVERIDVESEFDSDGDPILRTIVVLRHPNRLKREALVSFQRLVFDRIWKETDAFPMVIFRSAEDDKGMASEAA